MRRDAWSESECPIARTMALVGQPWAILILREAFLGRTRFSEFRSELGVASDVLSARLGELVAGGVLEVVDYQVAGDRRRSRYVLTDDGHALITVVAAMGQWGRVHLPRPDSSEYRFVETATGEPARLGFHRHDGRRVQTAEVTLMDRAAP